ARARLEGIARVTPVFGSETFSRRAGREVLLKAENLQRTGAFKIRGAVNKIATLSDAERAAGVVAASAGNHGQAVAWAAREQGVGATVFMPQDSPMAKVDATRNYGATVELGGMVFEEAVAAAEEYVERSGATFIHPFEDEVVAVADEEISEAIVLLLERTKLLVEGAGAASVAAVLGGHVSGDGPVCALLSGGNIDPTLLISVMRHGLTLAGRYLVVRTRVPDRPGELVRLLELVAKERGNLVSVEHHREGMAVPIAETEVELTLSTRDEEHCKALLDALREQGYEVERLR
ncbi:MAG: pyridoxal-phosphate dependent enzyme, partial [Actinomycetota bacterium]|nr:pyridoxal-phosphate dependent enzyme [Actinomycetota bacterium]